MRGSPKSFRMRFFIVLICILTLQSAADDSCEILIRHKSVMAKVMREGGNYVSADPNAIENSRNFNCHGYMCWQMGLIAEPLQLENSVFIKATLRSYFKRIVTFRHTAIQRIPTSPKLQAGDVVAFYDVKEPDDWEDEEDENADEYHFSHSGIVIERETPAGKVLWIRSKIGKSGVADLSMEQVFKLYGSPTVRIQFWRKSEPN